MSLPYKEGQVRVLLFCLDACHTQTSLLLSVLSMDCARSLQLEAEQVSVPTHSLWSLAEFLLLITTSLIPGNWAQPPSSWQRGATAEPHLAFFTCTSFTIRTFLGHVASCQQPCQQLCKHCLAHNPQHLPLWFVPARSPVFPSKMCVVGCLWQHQTLTAPAQSGSCGTLRSLAHGSQSPKQLWLFSLLFLAPCLCCRIITYPAES